MSNESIMNKEPKLSVQGSGQFEVFNLGPPKQGFTEQNITLESESIGPLQNSQSNFILQTLQSNKSNKCNPMAVLLQIVVDRKNSIIQLGNNIDFSSETLSQLYKQLENISFFYQQIFQLKKHQKGKTLMFDGVKLIEQKCISFEQKLINQALNEFLNFQSIDQIQDGLSYLKEFVKECYVDIFEEYQNLMDQVDDQIPTG